MKIYEEYKLTYKWLESHGFSYYDIIHLVKLYKGLPFQMKLESRHQKSSTSIYILKYL